MDNRVSWDEYFMNVARVVATRDLRPQARRSGPGTRQDHPVHRAANGSIRGLPHCTEAGHMMEDGHCVATVHAEANAIIQAAKNGVAIEGASIYTTASRVGRASSSSRTRLPPIVFGEFYRDERIFEYAQRLGIELVEPRCRRRTCSRPTPGTARTFTASRG